ncbi:hypothetical protein HMPREF0972_00066 [Actinomyces sp. oral taxon 848 str. F0332]|nr:hypothetical protein HMPREF0972_00066 [Actinomyces sp. oral taxon 848 str. F0332]
MNNASEGRLRGTPMRGGQMSRRHERRKSQAPAKQVPNRSRSRTRSPRILSTSETSPGNERSRRRKRREPRKRNETNRRRRPLKSALRA